MNDDAALDTNIVSYIMKNRPQASRYLAYLRGKTQYISFITLAEIRFGAEKAGWGQPRRTAAENLLSTMTIIPYHEAILNAYVQCRLHREKVGRSTEFEDLWIAATAIATNMPLVTHNPSDFEHIPGLNIITFA